MESENSHDATYYKIASTIYVSRQFLHYHLWKSNDFFYGNHQTSFCTWYICEGKDNANPIELQEFEYFQMSHKYIHIACLLML